MWYTKSNEFYRLTTYGSDIDMLYLTIHFCVADWEIGDHAANRSDVYRCAAVCYALFMWEKRDVSNAYIIVNAGNCKLSNMGWS